MQCYASDTHIHKCNMKFNVKCRALILNVSNTPLMGVPCCWKYQWLESNAQDAAFERGHILWPLGRAVCPVLKVQEMNTKPSVFSRSYAHIIVKSQRPNQKGYIDPLLCLKYRKLCLISPLR